MADFSNISNTNLKDGSYGYTTGHTSDMIFTKKSIGYAEGYTTNKRKTGGHTEDGTTIVEVPPTGKELVKSDNLPEMFDNHSNKFRTINGYGNSQNDYEDPTYLIFDLNIMNSISSLFSDNTKKFISEYSNFVPELEERLGYLEEFTNRLLEIFPGDFDPNGTSGIKRHYIEGVGGLDTLTKPIIDYGTDIITFTITEDVAMTLQYLAELYNNLIYSYNTHRYLIPDNLLRFNMKITIRDIRNMKNENDKINENISKFIYVLHDCQFDFMSTKSWGADIKRAGFSAAAPGISAGGTISMNFKSYSKITAPLLKNNYKIIDFKEYEPTDSFRTTFDGDYKSQDEVEENMNINIFKENSESLSNSDRKSNLPGGIQIPEINTSIRGFTDNIKNEISEVREVIIQKVYEEVNILVTRGQRWIGDNLGFTVGKVNVYYDSLEEKITNFSFMFSNLLDKKVDEWFGRDIKITRREGNVYSEKRIGPKNDNDTKLEHRTIDLTNNRSTKDNDRKLHNRTVDLTSTTHPDGTANRIYPDGTYNEKYPEGDVHPDGIYNQKFPNGDVHPDGIYNEKFPKGDVMKDGVYNEKYPEGDVHPDGIYNNNPPKGNIYNKVYKDLPPVNLKNVYK